MDSIRKVRREKEREMEEARAQASSSGRLPNQLQLQAIIFSLYGLIKKAEKRDCLLC